MAVHALLRIEATPVNLTPRASGYLAYWRCDTESELPTADVVNGDSAVTYDTGKRWTRTAGVWVEDNSDNIAAWGNIGGTLSDQTDLQSALNAKQATLVSATNIKTINGSSVLGSGDLVVSGSGAAWGGITGTLSSQTDLQTALDGKQPVGTYATGGGTATGTNTGDNAVNSLYSGLAASKQDTLVSATNIKTINGASVLGSGDLVVSSGYNAVATLASNQATAANTTPVTLTGLVWTFAANSVYFSAGSAPFNRRQRRPDADFSLMCRRRSLRSA